MVNFTHDFWLVISECLSKSVIYACAEGAFESNFDFKMFLKKFEKRKSGLGHYFLEILHNSLKVNKQVLLTSYYYFIL